MAFGLRQLSRFALILFNTCDGVFQRLAFASVFFLGQEIHHRYEEDHLQHVDHVREVENLLGNFPIDRKSQKLEVPGCEGDCPVVF